MGEVGVCGCDHGHDGRDGEYGADEVDVVGGAGGADGADVVHVVDDGSCEVCGAQNEMVGEQTNGSARQEPHGVVGLA